MGVSFTLPVKVNFHLFMLDTTYEKCQKGFVQVRSPAQSTCWSHCCLRPHNPSLKAEPHNLSYPFLHCPPPHCHNLTFTTHSESYHRLWSIDPTQSGSHVTWSWTRGDVTCNLPSSSGWPLRNCCNGGETGFKMNLDQNLSIVIDRNYHEILKIY